MVRWFKPVVFLACLGPLARLGWKAYTGRLRANPIEVITHSTGDWILIFLLVTLCITPVRKLTGQLWLIRYRRMFGLFAFFYAVLHFLTYIWLDKFFNLHEMWADVSKRRFITIGFTGFVLLIPLALTSTTGWIRRLGHVCMDFRLSEHRDAARYFLFCGGWHDGRSHLRHIQVGRISACCG